MIRGAIGRVLRWFIDAADDDAKRMQRNDELHTGIVDRRGYWHPSQVPPPPRPQMAPPPPPDIGGLIKKGL